MKQMIGIGLLSVWGMMTLGAEASEPYSRDAVQQEILEAFDEVEKARNEAAALLVQTVESVENARAVRLRNDDAQKAYIEIAEVEAVAKIAEATALVELAKIEAAKIIADAVDRVEAAKTKSLAGTLEALQRQAMKEIAKAIALVEQTKAKAMAVIVEVTGDVERSKVTPAPKYKDIQTAVMIAKDRASVKIAKAVAAVEVAQATAKVEIAKAVDPAELASLYVSDEDDLEKVKHRADASISSAMKKLEVARANAMAEIAKAKGAVEIAQKVSTQRKEKEPNTIPAPGYPQKLLYYK